MTGEATLSPGELLRLSHGVDWHNGYVIDGFDRIQAEMHITKRDVALYVSTAINRYDASRRYRCIVGGLLVLLNPICLVACGEEVE